MTTVDPSSTEAGTPGEEQLATYAFLTPEQVPMRRNQMMAAGLAAVAILVLGAVVTLMLPIRYDNLPSLLSSFS